jgi:hypothetical protein
MKFRKPTDSGIGVHLTAYEDIKGYCIPELFLISNWTNEKYEAIHSDGVHLSRETFHTMTKQNPKSLHRDFEYRDEVYKYIKEGNWLMYNNGDPLMFNIVARAIFGAIRVIVLRRKLINLNEIRTYLAIARRPIEIVSKAQIDFCHEGARIVGGKPHDLAITPDGLYSSTTGDK